MNKRCKLSDAVLHRHEKGIYNITLAHPAYSIFVSKFAECYHSLALSAKIDIRRISGNTDHFGPDLLAGLESIGSSAVFLQQNGKTLFLKGNRFLPRNIQCSIFYAIIRHML